MEIAGIVISVVLAMIAALFYAKWQQVKKLLAEVAQALTVTSKALEDDNVTDAERNQILTEWADVIRAARGLFGP